MATVLAVALAWSSRSPETLDGQVTYYSPGLMQQVAENRGLSLEGYAGGVALNRRGDLGRVVWLEFDGAIDGPFLVVDCARREHYESREQRSRVVEVDAQTAMRRGFYGVRPVSVKVFFDDSVSCTGIPCFE